MPKGDDMIVRVWRGWTTFEGAGAYEALLKEQIFPAIFAKSIAGFKGIELLRTDRSDDVEFMTIMRFDRIESVQAFVGDDIGVAYVPAEARRVLARFEERSTHYELRVARRPT